MSGHTIHLPKVIETYTLRQAIRINANMASMGLRKTTKYTPIAAEISRISESLC
jgi:hypothetical protein